MSMLLLLLARRERATQPPACMTEEASGVQQAASSPHDEPTSHGYDVRGGASGYVQAISTFGALTLPSIILVLQSTYEVHGSNGRLGRAAFAQDQVLAVSLLALALLGCVAASFGFAAIAGERKLTPNLIPAAMLVSIPATLGLLALFAGIAAAVTLYVPKVAGVFVFLAGVAGVMGVALTAAAAVDARLVPEPPDSTARPRWMESPGRAFVHVIVLVVSTAAAASAVLVWRLNSSWALSPGPLLNTLLISTVAVMFGSVGFAVVRSAHTGVTSARLQLWEAYVYCGLLGAFSLSIIAAIPLAP